MMHMDCPKCGNLAANNLNGRHCDECGLDIVLHKMARDMSDRYYNIGLRRAKSGDLSAAVKAIGISLQIDKRNLQARNLLGLVLFHTGRIGEALREWAISLDFGPEDNRAKGYLESFNGDIPLVEKYSEAIIKYNEALIYAEKYSEDLSEIRLKRAVEILPNFVNALNLLALHHLKNGDKTRAAALVERVLAIDSGNEVAKRYYFEIFQKYPSRRHPSQKYSSQRQSSGQKTRTIGTAARPETLKDRIVSSFGPKGPKKESKEPQESREPKSSNPFAARTKRAIPKVSPLSGIIAALLGMGAMFLFMYLLVFPGMLADRDRLLENLQADFDNTAIIARDMLEERDDTINRLNTELDEITARSQQQAATIFNLENELRVHNSLNYLNLNNPSQALNLLNITETEQLSETILGIYNHIRQTATPQVEQIYFTQGQTLFNLGNFAEARIALEHAALHALPASTIADDVLYFLGRIAENDGDIALAILYYQNIIENHPNSNRYWPARNRLNIIS
jgi:tetratricopeptide (TPR) repeat protein